MKDQYKERLKVLLEGDGVSHLLPEIMALQDKGTGYGLQGECGSCHKPILMYRFYNPDGSPHNCK